MIVRQILGVLQPSLLCAVQRGVPAFLNFNPELFGVAHLLQGSGVLCSGQGGDRVVPEENKKSEPFSKRK